MSEVHFTFEEWVSTLDKNQTGAWAKKFDCFAKTEENQQEWRAMWTRSPKYALWWCFRNQVLVASR